MTFENYTNEELEKFAHLRALEWFSWPIFLSHSIVPVLLAATQSWLVIVIALVIDFVWHFICNRFIDVDLAIAGLFMFRLRWIAAPASAIFLFFHHRYGLAVVALLWPLLATLLSGVSTRLAYISGGQADLSELERGFRGRIGRPNLANKPRSVTAMVIIGLSVLVVIGVFADIRQRTSAHVRTESELLHGNSASPPLSTPQATPAPINPASAVIEQPNPTPLKPVSQSVAQDASLPKARATYRVSGVRAGDFLNMRKGPGARYSVIQRLQNGVDGITLIGEPVARGSKRWQKINSRGVVGWVSADYLSPSMPATTPTPPLR